MRWVTLPDGSVYNPEMPWLSYRGTKEEIGNKIFKLEADRAARKKPSASDSEVASTLANIAGRVANDIGLSDVGNVISSFGGAGAAPGISSATPSFGGQKSALTPVAAAAGGPWGIAAAIALWLMNRK